MIPYPLVRPILFGLDPERAHALTFEALHGCRRLGLERFVRQTVPRDARMLMGIEVPNPIGLAAGLDKDGRHIDVLAALGFGFIEIGTVTPRPQPGNPRPRMFRLPAAEALINRMGFNNDGVDACITRIEASRFWRDGGVLGVNIGKNADTPIERAVDDYVHCLDKVHRLASYITVNISSPNTQQLRQLQDGRALEPLVEALVRTRDRAARRDGRRAPIAVKIAPDLDESQLDAIAEVVTRFRIDALIATNTTVSRDAVRGQRHADESGGLSGAPVRDRSTGVVRALRARVGADVTLIGVGGILSGDDARAKIEAGAQALQLYTGLIYRGPALIAECADALRHPRAPARPF